MPISYKIPSETVPDIADFFWAVVRAWSGLMSGGLIGGGLVLWGFTGSPVYPVVGLVISIAAIFAACYLLWKEERQKYLNIQDQKQTSENLFREDISAKRRAIEGLETDLRLERGKQSLPDLKGEILGAVFGEITHPYTRRRHTGFIVFIEVTNLGMPSVAKNWSARLALLNGSTLAAMPQHASEGFNLDSKSTFGADDNLIDKGMDAIATGHAARGYLLFLLEQPKEEINVADGVSLILFQDSTGNQHQMPITLPEHLGDLGAVHIPGMNATKKT